MVGTKATSKGPKKKPEAAVKGSGQVQVVYRDLWWFQGLGCKWAGEGDGGGGGGGLGLRRVSFSVVRMAIRRIEHLTTLPGSYDTS